MDYFRIYWDDPDDPEGNLAHIEEHGFSIEDVEEVLASPIDSGFNESSGRPCVWGYTPDGSHVIVIYEEIDEDSKRVVTAYEAPERR